MTDAPDTTTDQDAAGRSRSMSDQLSLVNANVDIPVNPGIAANVLPDGSVAPYPDEGDAGFTWTAGLRGPREGTPLA